jgi:hypothetical protein
MAGHWVARMAVRMADRTAVKRADSMAENLVVPME